MGDKTMGLEIVTGRNNVVSDLWVSDVALPLLDLPLAILCHLEQYASSSVLVSDFKFGANPALPGRPARAGRVPVDPG